MPTTSAHRQTSPLYTVLLAVIGVASWALPPAQNHRIAHLDVPEPTVALSLNGSSSYLGLAAGGALGGLAMGGGSLTVLVLTAAGVSLFALAAVATSSALLKGADA